MGVGGRGGTCAFFDLHVPLHRGGGEVLHLTRRVKGRKEDILDCNCIILAHRLITIPPLLSCSLPTLRMESWNQYVSTQLIATGAVYQVWILGCNGERPMSNELCSSPLVIYRIACYSDLGCHTREGRCASICRRGWICGTSNAPLMGVIDKGTLNN